MVARRGTPAGIASQYRRTASAHGDHLVRQRGPEHGRIFSQEPKPRDNGRSRCLAIFKYRGRDDRASPCEHGIGFREHHQLDRIRPRLSQAYAPLRRPPESRPQRSGILFSLFLRRRGVVDPCEGFAVRAFASLALPAVYRKRGERSKFLPRLTLSEENGARDGT